LFIPVHVDYKIEKKINPAFFLKKCWIPLFNYSNYGLSFAEYELYGFSKAESKYLCFLCAHAFG
ncbi:MAG: hypothetical protein PHG06_22165, partial [Parabacteroides sp.]|nr:hypothetical protein [Parabacteroides sp.]